MSRTLASVRDLAPVVRKHAEQIEQERRLPEDLLAELRAAGCFRMVAARRHGGDELGLPDLLEVIEELAAADGSTAWTVAQAAVAQLIVRYFPAETVDLLYAGGPDLMGAGAVAPKGRAEEEDGGGWRVTGEWPFVTGVPYAAWVYLQCLATRDGRPQLDDDGVPRTRLVLLPAADVTVLDTWDAMGLCGTASHDVRVRRAVCPPERTCGLSASPQAGGPLSAIPARDTGGLFVAAVVLGLARSALEQTTTLARGGKRPAFSPARLADAPVFQDRLGEADIALRAAQALLRREAGEAWAAAELGQRPDELSRARLRAAPATVTGLAQTAVQCAFQLAGGTAPYRRSGVQRCLRDTAVAGQHFSVGRDFYRTLGAVLGGADTGIGLR
jgi:indole-3-acetate monooxygenase